MVHLALRDTELFDEWLRTAPVVVPLGRTAPPGGGESVTARHQVASRARAEYRTLPALAALTSQEAYVSDALRQSGLPRHQDGGAGRS